MASEIEVPEWRNGSFVVVLNKLGHILLVREKAKNLLELPGGGIERGELPTHAGQSETEEESGVAVDEHDFRLIGLFIQRPDGLVTLFESRRYKGEPTIYGTNREISEAGFFDFDDIMEKGEDDVRTGALRMIIRWKRCELGIDPTPYIRGNLSEEVELPRNYKELEGSKFRNEVYRF